jgi:hypothetical protein
MNHHTYRPKIRSTEVTKRIREQDQYHAKVDAGLGIVTLIGVAIGKMDSHDCLSRVPNPVVAANPPLTTILFHNFDRISIGHSSIDYDCHPHDNINT